MSNRPVQFMLYGMCVGLLIGTPLWVLTNNALYIFVAWLIGLLIGLVLGVVTKDSD